MKPGDWISQQHADGLLLVEEAFCKGLQRVSALLEELLVDRQAQQPKPAWDPARAAMLPF